MRHAFLACLLPAVALAAPARAEVLVSTPWVTVHVGRPARADVLVATPWTTVHVGQPGLPPPVVALPAEPQPLPLPPAGPEVVVPPTVVPGPVSVRPPTLAEFAASFHPAPGHYEVVLLNPETCCPTKVCFTLPCGCPTVRVHEKSLVFHYGLLDNVAIRFHHDGSVTVKD
jgi:hypothetical protein